MPRSRTKASSNMATQEIINSAPSAPRAQIVTWNLKGGALVFLSPSALKVGE